LKNLKIGRADQAVESKAGYTPVRRVELFRRGPVLMAEVLMAEVLVAEVLVADAFALRR